MFGPDPTFHWDQAIGTVLMLCGVAFIVVVIVLLLVVGLPAAMLWPGRARESKMLRASMSVVLKNGTRYSANHIATVRRAGTSDKTDLTFLCSGEQTTKPAEDVDHIEYRGSGAVHCEACDQRIDRPEDYRPMVGSAPAGGPETTDH